MGRPTKNLIGLPPFGRLTVTAGPLLREKRPGARETWWECRCACGNTGTYRAQYLLSGHTTSCGCVRAERAATMCKKGDERARKLSSGQKRQAVLDYEAGKSAPAIAAELNVHPTTIWGHLKRRGVVMRDAGEANRTIPLNQDAFAGELSDEAAYWVGVLITDGNVHRRPGSSSAVVSLAMNDGDAEHIEKFRDFLGSGHKIDTQPQSAAGYGGANGRPLTRLAVPSAKLAEDLARYGVVPKKSRTADPIGGVEHRAAFWRGAVDGDGHMMWKNNVPTIGMTGSRGTCEKFLAFVRGIHPGCNAKLRQQGAVFHARVCSLAALKTIRLLYQDAPVSLGRKQELADRIIKARAELAAAKIPPVACSVAGCDQEVHGLGFCKKHHKRHRKHGSPEAVGSRWGGVKGAGGAQPRPMRKRRQDATPDGFQQSQPA